jgi:DNA-binding CsgD family transcriptional regulator
MQSNLVHLNKLMNHFLDYGLTVRELEIFELLVLGMSTARMSDRFSVSIKTIEQHKINLYRKLGVHTRQQAIDKWKQVVEHDDKGRCAVLGGGLCG